MPKKTKLISIRVMEAEHKALQKRANGLSLSAYIRACLFADTRLSSQDDKKLLAQILAKLGQSNIANHLRDLANLARSGSLPLTPETTAKLDQACQDIAEIKSSLMNALRIKED